MWKPTQMMMPMARSFPKKNTFWTVVASLTLLQLMKVTTAGVEEVMNLKMNFFFSGSGLLTY